MQSVTCKLNGTVYVSETDLSSVVCSQFVASYLNQYNPNRVPEPNKIEIQYDTQPFWGATSIRMKDWERRLVMVGGDDVVQSYRWVVDTMAQMKRDNLHQSIFYFKIKAL